MNITIPTIAADSIALILAPATKADPTDDACYLRELTVFGLNPKTRHEPSAQAEINLGHLICRDSPLLNEQVKIMQGQVEEHFGRHPDAEIILSQPGMGPILGARVLAEFGDAPGCYADAKARKNYAGTSPITRASGRKKVVCPVRPQRPPRRRGHITGPIRAAGLARAYYDKQRHRGLDHNAALRQLANRLVGILHGGLKPRTLYDEATAWSHNKQDQQPAA